MASLFQCLGAGSRSSDQFATWGPRYFAWSLVISRWPTSPMLKRSHSISRRAAGQIGFHVGEQGVDPDRLGGERHFLRVAEAELQLRPLAGGLGDGGFEAAPEADDLLQPVFAAVVFAEGLDGFAQGAGGLVVLPAVFVDARDG